METFEIYYLCLAAIVFVAAAAGCASLLAKNGIDKETFSRIEGSE